MFFDMENKWLVIDIYVSFIGEILKIGVYMVC